MTEWLKAMIDTSCMVSTRVQLPQGDIGKRLEALFYFCAQNVWIPLTPQILLPISTTFKSFFCAFSIISSSLWQQPWRSVLILCTECLNSMQVEVSTRVQLPHGDSEKYLRELFYFRGQNVWILLTPRRLLTRLSLKYLESLIEI